MLHVIDEIIDIIDNILLSSINTFIINRKVLDYYVIISTNLIEVLVCFI